jgi:hypothetical protein
MDKKAVGALELDYQLTFDGQGLTMGQYLHRLIDTAPAGTTWDDVAAAFLAQVGVVFEPVFVEEIATFCPDLPHVVQSTDTVYH